MMRAATYARVSTSDQTVDNQLTDLQAYVQQRGWGEAVVYSHKASGAKDRRPGLDDLLKAGRRPLSLPAGTVPSRRSELLAEVS